MGFLTFFIPLTLDSIHFNDIKQLKLVQQPGEQFMLCIKLVLNELQFEILLGPGRFFCTPHVKSIN